MASKCFIQLQYVWLFLNTRCVNDSCQSLTPERICLQEQRDENRFFFFKKEKFRTSLNLTRRLKNVTLMSTHSEKAAICVGKSKTSV